MRPIRVLHVVGRMDRGGVETWLMHLLRHRDRMIRHEFLVHSSQPGDFDEEISALGSPIYRMPEYRNPLRYVPRLRDHLIGEGPYDVVHSHVHYFSGIVLRAAHAAGVRKRIAHSHNDTREVDASAGLIRHEYARVMRRWIDRYATDRIAASEKAGEALFGSTNGAARRWRVVYYGHDFRRFAAPERDGIRSQLGIGPHALVVGHVGRFDPQKNHGFITRIFEQVVHRNSSAVLLLVGDGPLRDAVAGEIRRLGLGERVIFAGSRSDVPELLTSSVDVFLFPSLHEGLPLACVEAQAAGLPLVISDSITEELDVVPSLVRRLPLARSATVWADACLDAAAAPRLGRASALSVLERSAFTVEASLRSLQDVYRSPFHTGSGAAA